MLATPARWGSGDGHESNESQEDEATQNGKAAAPYGDYTGSPDRGQKEDRAAHAQAHGDLPRAERGAGAGDGNLTSPWRHQQFANRPQARIRDHSRQRDAALRG